MAGVSRITFFLLVLALIAGCRQQPTYGTPVEALTEFPGYLNGDVPPSFRLLAQSTIPRGEILLYAFGGTRPDVEGQTCVATTFVSEEGDGRWRAQSSASLGCRSDFPEPEEIVLAYTVGGNVTELTTVYGLVPAGEMVLVHWQDGLVEVGEIKDGTVLLPRTDTLHPDLVEIRDEAGNALHIEEIR